MLKKILTPFLVLLGIALIIWAGYYFRYRGPEAGPQAGLPLPPPQTLPTGIVTGPAPATSSVKGGVLPQEGFSLVTTNPAAAYYPVSAGEILLIQPTGQILRLTSAATEVLASAEIPDLVDAEFSSDGRFLLVQFRESGAARWSVFDLSKKSWRPLEVDAAGPAWSPSGAVLAYLAPAANGLAVATLDFGLPEPKPVEVTRLAGHDLLLDWAGPDRLMLSERPSSQHPASLWSIDVRSKKVSLLRILERGLMAAWNADGSRGLLFQTGTARRGGSLVLTDGQGLVLRRLNLLTLPSKCIFPETKSAGAVATSTQKGTSTSPAVPKDTLICGVPRLSLLQAELPDDYLTRALFTDDDIFRIDLEKGVMQNIPLPGAVADVTQIKTQGDRLFFVNRLDDRLYSAPLPAAL